MKIKKNIFFFFEGVRSEGGGGFGLGGQGGCERRIEVFGKIQKKMLWGLGVGSGWGSGRGVRLDVNEELKFFVKIQKKKFEGVGGSRGEGLCWADRVDVNGQKAKGSFQKIHKKKIGWGGGVGRWGVRWGVGLVGVRVDVNEELKFL